MMGTREQFKNGDEWDYLTKGRKYHKTRAGDVAKIKRSFWKRIRSKVKQEIKAEQF